MSSRIEVVIALDAMGQPVPYESERWVRAEVIEHTAQGDTLRHYLMRDAEEAPDVPA